MAYSHVSSDSSNAVVKLGRG